MNELKIKKILREFSKKRDWDQFHSPKNLSMALSVEASELVEIYQWQKEDEYKKNDMEIKVFIQELKGHEDYKK